MMGLDERVFHLILGFLIGFIFGYFSKKLQKIEDEVVSIDKRRDEDGFMRNPFVADVAMVFVLSLCLIATWMSGKAVQDVREDDKQDDKQDAIVKAVSECSSEILALTVLALNERTEYSTTNTRKNVELIESQRIFLTQGVGSIPPPTREEFRKSLEEYIKAAETFVESANKTLEKSLEYQYPEKYALDRCINERIEND